MRGPSSGVRLSNGQVAQLESRRKKLGLTRVTLLRKFEGALRRAGCIHTDAAAKMRLDRVFNRRMRRPMSDETEAALAEALDWSVPQLENSISLGSKTVHKTSTLEVKLSRPVTVDISRDLVDAAIRLQRVVRILQASLTGS